MKSAWRMSSLVQSMLCATFASNVIYAALMQQSTEAITFTYAMSATRTLGVLTSPTVTAAFGSVLCWSIIPTLSVPVLLTSATYVRYKRQALSTMERLNTRRLWTSKIAGSLRFHLRRRSRRNLRARQRRRKNGIKRHYCTKHHVNHWVGNSSEKSITIRIIEFALLGDHPN